MCKFGSNVRVSYESFRVLTANLPQTQIPEGRTCLGLTGGSNPAPSPPSSSSSNMPVMLGGLLLGGWDGSGGSVESVATADTTLPPAQTLRGLNPDPSPNLNPKSGNAQNAKVEE